MRIYNEPGKLEVVSFELRELANISEEDFCKKLYRHTEQIELENSIFIDALEQVNNGANYQITEDDDPVNKVRSWIDCLRFLNRYISDSVIDNAGDAIVGFEYHLKKRWVDVLILSAGMLTILEFKSGRSDDSISIAQYIKQLKRYYNLIRRGNKTVVQLIDARALEIKKYLVFTNSYMIGRVPDAQGIVVGDEFATVLENISGIVSQEIFEQILDNEKYIDPSISGALVSLIKTGIVDYVVKENDNVSLCSGIIEDVLQKQERTLGIIFVKGGPGTGKTGTAFTLLEECLTNGNNKVQYVTGNGNLESYFTSIVENTINNIRNNNIENPLFKNLVDTGLIESLDGLGEQLIGHINTLYNPHKLCDKYVNLVPGAQIPTVKDQILLVDEAQRLWNALNIASSTKKVKGEYKKEYTDKEQHAIYGYELSESFQLILGMVHGALEQQENKCLVLFVGSGQEINNGEEDGEKDIISSICRIKRYIDRCNLQINLRVYTPDKSTEQVLVASNVSCCNAEDYQGLILIQNQRNDQGDPKLEIVSSILDEKTCNFKGQTGYEVYEKIEDIARILRGSSSDNYTEKDDSYGIVIDSYDINSENERSISIQGRHLIDAGRELYSFFYKRQSNNLNVYVTQFGCQGLEFDDSIMVWGDTLRWDQKKGCWKINEDKWPNGKSRYGSIWWHVDGVNKLIRWRNEQTGSKIQELDYKSLRRQFIMNAYRVLLTRARETTYILVEDEATRIHLKNILQ